MTDGPEAAGAAPGGALGAAARGPRWWVTALARQPVVSGTVLLVVALCVTLLVVRPTEVLAAAAKQALYSSWLAIIPIREWVLRREAATGRPMSPPPWRSPVEVSGSVPVRPRWRWSSALGRACLGWGLPFASLAVFFAAGGLWLLGQGDGAGDVVAAVVVAVLAVVAALLAWFVLDKAPAGARAVARSTRLPVTVRVVGIEPDGQRWLVRPVDGWRTVRLDAFRGRTRIVAGDVLHLWRPETEPEHDRVALTGPFGVLWPRLASTYPALEPGTAAVDDGTAPADGVERRTAG